MTNIEILEYVCADDENVSLILLDLDYENTSSDSFNLSIDGVEIGTFAYADLPLEIENESAANFLHFV